MVEKVRTWCHKILPLVYDDSLSYYEVLCKLIAKINELIDYINKGISDEVKKYVMDIINKLVILYSYDETNLRLTFGVHSTDEGGGGCDKHVYKSGTETIEIIEGSCKCNSEE